MKKIIAILLIAIVCIGMVACGEITTGTSSIEKQSPTETTPKEQKYTVTIDSHRVGKDYEGKDALIVDYTFTNNDEKEASFILAVTDKAYQNGIELASAIISGDDNYNSENSMKNIKQGATLKVQQAFVLDDKSDVTLELTELFNFDKTKITEKILTLQ